MRGEDGHKASYEAGATTMMTSQKEFCLVQVGPWENRGNRKKASGQYFVSDSRKKSAMKNP